MYEKFMKHAKKVAKDLSGSKPALEGVLHKVNGDLCATNAHMLYYGKKLDDHLSDEDSVITPTGKKLDLKYPDVSRLIPDYEPNFQATINVNEFIQAIDLVHIPGRLDKEVTDMIFEGNTILYRGVGITAKHTMSISMPKGDSFTSSAEYWLNALRMFKDFGYTEVKFNFFSSLRPFTLVSPDDQLTALITPMRRF